VLVTAINLDVGSRIWWPSRLDRASRAHQDDVVPVSAGAAGASD
jgi:hypothetical protein